VSEFWDIVRYFSENSAVPCEQLLGARRIVYHKGIPDFEEASDEPRLVVLDDLLNKAYSRYVCGLFPKGSHHRDISVIFITRNVFHQECFSRDILLNAKYLVVFKNVRGRNQFTYLARQVYPEDSNGLYESYLDATRKPHGYLLLGLAQDTANFLRFRTNTFPSEVTVVYAPLGDETDAVEL